MEEDIKILEEYLLNLKKFSGEEIIKSDEILKFIDYKEIKAIENLIKRYKEKEESEAYLYDAYQDVGRKMFEYAEKCDELEVENKSIKEANIYWTERYCKVNNDSILKSKIEELKEANEKKIEELRPYKHQCPFDFGVLNGIDEAYRTLLGREGN